MIGASRARSAVVRMASSSTRLEQAGLADGELRGVDADREPARACIEIVARERALAAAIEFAITVERERMRRDHHALAQRGEHVRRLASATS
jgi:hypothetical protein